MKLHDIVELRESLKTAFPTEQIIAELDSIVENMGLISQRYNEDYQYRLSEVIKTVQSIKESLSKPMDQLDDVHAIIKKDLADATAKFSLPEYEGELRYANPDVIRETRKLYVPTGVDEIIRRSIDMYVDWRYPGLEIGCRDGEFTEFLVSLDPLYITDVLQPFIDSTLSKFPAEYQRRLRPYMIKDHDLSMLPKQQFGFIFSWNFFNYVTITQLERYLEQSFDLLRPGGVFMFSYNNCDMPAAAAYADSYYMSYVPKSQLLPICERLGYELISSTDLEPAVSWIELRKPGELKMIKAHQVLGEIKYVSP